MTDSLALHLSKVSMLFSSSRDMNHLASHFLWAGSLTRDKFFSDTSRMCPKCCQLWSVGKFSVSLKGTPIPGPRMKRILNSHRDTPHKLNAVELSLLKRFKQNHLRKMILSCHVCKHRTTVPLKNRVLEESFINSTPKMAESELVKKKKKKKDRFAGLNASAVLSVSPSPLNYSLKINPKFNSPSISVTPVAKIPGKDGNATPVLNISSQMTNSTPETPRLQLDAKKKSKPKSLKQKMNFLREEVKRAEQNRVLAENKALALKNLNVKKNIKLQDFLSKREKDIHVQDRINCLLQM